MIDYKGQYNSRRHLREKNRVPKYYEGVKRLMDITLAGLGILILSPLLLFISIIIKLEDPSGPVLFKQKRVGKDGEKFNILKFRSMIVNAEDKLENLMEMNEATGPLFKMKKDPRITKVGKFIRKTSIDELPQLINVIKGEMSLVGPRPPLPREVECYSSYEMQRLKVKQGLTCYWQVSGRSNISFKEQVDLDLKYINNQSILLDSILIVKTIFVLFGTDDAF